MIYYNVTKKAAKVDRKFIFVVKYSLASVVVIFIALKIAKWCTHALRLGTTPLTQASELGDLDSVRILVEQGVNINEKEKGKKYRTPLIAATEGGYEEVVQYLLIHHADPNLQDMNGDTALMWAVRQGDKNQKLVALLLNAGSSVNISNHLGSTALDYAKAAILNRQIRFELDKASRTNDKRTE